MRIFYRPKSNRLLPSEIVILSGAKNLLFACCCIFLISLFASSLSAQTLARPGWAGAGIASDAWWRNAIFYRIDVRHFQDSDGDGIGDLAGITQRLDYLQSLGVDAIVITIPPDEVGFDDLLRAASAHRIRLVIALDHAANPAEILGLARLWLTRGAGGISIEAPLLAANSATIAPLHELRALTHSFPGDRVLLARPGTQTLPSDAADLITQIVDASISAVAEKSPTNPRKTSATPSSVPLLEGDNRLAETTAGDPARSLGLQKIIAMKLLMAHGAVSLLYGQELGMLGTSPPVPATMQWTPSNVTPPKVEPVPEEPSQPAAPPPPEDVYGAFKPYFPPKPKPKPAVTSEGLPIVDPNSLPGFSNHEVPNALAPNHATGNVAVEDADLNSTLNYYRRLIQLHHDNPSVRSGVPLFLNHDAENALVWLRRPPGGARTATTVIIACNLSDKPLTLSLDNDLVKLHLIVGSLRPMAASWTAFPPSQPSGAMMLPPFSAYMGELYH